MLISKKVFASRRDEMWKIALVVFSAAFAVGVGEMMVGGFSNIDVNNEGAQNALKYAVSQHNQRSNDIYASKATEVVSVQRQVSNVLFGVISFCFL